MRIRFGVGFIVAASILAGAGCGQGGSPGRDGPSTGDRGAALVTMSLSVEGLADVALNQPVVWEFSEPVRKSSVRADTFRVRSGDGFGKQAPGRFVLEGRRVTFLPRLPSRADLSDAGLQPATTYRISVASYPSPSAPRSTSGAWLTTPVEATFTTVAADSPHLFTAEGIPADAPRPIKFSPRLGLDHAHPLAQVTVDWSAPLDPRTVSEDTVTLHMTSRRGVATDYLVRGRPLLRQSHEKVEVSFDPKHPLPSEATFELRFATSVTHLARGLPLGPRLGAVGHSTAPHLDARAYHWWTTDDPGPRLHATVLQFNGHDEDEDGGAGRDASATTASFNDVVPGAVSGVFTAAGGDGRLGDFRPEVDTVLSTLSPSAVDGAFHYRNIEIPAGVTVTLRGALPARLLAVGDVLVAGRLSADGGRGADGESGVDNVFAPAAGGVAGPSGGIGGEPYTGPDWDGSVGGTGGDAVAGGRGGAGGHEADTAWGGFGGGGGGGGGAFAGNYGQHGQYPTRASWNAPGGAGGAAGGIEPDSSLTAGGREFHLYGAGGGGGGSGGNGHYYPKSRENLNGAASGGGGGGALLLQAGGNIRIEGTVSADGGDGGDTGAGAVTNYGGAGGGGGGGGTVALYAAGAIALDGGTLSVQGGEGGASAGNLWPGRGGEGGAGRIRFEDGDGEPEGLASGVLLPDYYTFGSFHPVARASDTPTVFTGTWFDCGLFDATLQAPMAWDFPGSAPPGAGVRIEMQMAVADPARPHFADAGAVVNDFPGTSDENRASPWVVLRSSDGAFASETDLAVLTGRGFRFFRVRITFLPAEGAALDAPVPYVDAVRLRWRH